MIKVKNMTSAKSGREVANQFIVNTDNGVYFQSYNSVIAFKPSSDHAKTMLDEETWNYSVTTTKYRNRFLGENTEETRKKINNGEYILTNLNN